VSSLALLVYHGYCYLTIICVHLIFTDEKVEVFAIFFDPLAIWVCRSFLSLVQSWYLSSLIIVTHSIIPLCWQSLRKEPLCLFLAAFMIIWAKETGIWPKLQIIQVVDKGTGCSQPSWAFLSLNVWKLFSEQWRNEGKFLFCVSIIHLLFPV
jgi:hypothetical protein